MSTLEYFPSIYIAVAVLFVLAAWLVHRSLTRLVKLVGVDASDTRLRSAKVAGWIIWLIALSAALLSVWYWQKAAHTHSMEIAKKRQAVWPVYNANAVWNAPDLYLAETDDNRKLIAYGRDLIAHTQDYFGPNGKIAPNKINALNCQSCHLNAGTKPFGNNYGAVSSTYPQFRARSGQIETIAKRVNDCFMRSLNGAPLDSTSREMLAIQAYIHWLGTGVPKGEKPKGSGLTPPPFMLRAASPDSGRIVYETICARCHGLDGQGLKIPGSEQFYPPLWGERSYNKGAGLYRLSRFAAYVKNNMPWGVSYENPQLTDTQAWDVAAYVNSQPRPEHPFLHQDWPDISKKVFDHPFGPYADSFPEHQHKYGPFQPIIDATNQANHAKK